MSGIYVGIDFHKQNSVLYTTDQNGEIYGKEPRLKTLKTSDLISYFSNKESCHIAIEATGGVNHYVEKLQNQGHSVHLINPNKFRGIGISGKKTDERDAKALNVFIRLNPDSDCEVHLKSQYSRNLKSLLVSRELIVQTRVSLTNHIRGILREQGITITAGPQNFWKEASLKIDQVEEHLLKVTLRELYEQSVEIKNKEEAITSRIELVASKDSRVKMLRTMPGIGLLVASAMVAVVDDVSRFKSASYFASYLGLVPRVSASANSRMMGSITKSGNEILRRYLIHGARAWLKKRTAGTDDAVRKWALEVETRRGTNKAVVALARKMSCISYAMLRDGREYKEFILEVNLEEAL